MPDMNVRDHRVQEGWSSDGRWRPRSAATRARTAESGRTIRVTVRFTSSEFGALFTRVNRTAGNVSDYLRRCALGRRIVGRIDVRTREMLMTVLASLRVALAAAEGGLREAAVRSATAQGERALAGLLSGSDGEQ